MRFIRLIMMKIESCKMLFCYNLQIPIGTFYPYLGRTPFSIRSNIETKLDARLIEATLSSIDYPDWQDKLRETFSDFELSFEGGESSRATTERAIAAIKDAQLLEKNPLVLVTHGRLLTLILKHFDSKYGFKEWQNLTTPDVFSLVIKENESQVQRIWQ